MKLRDIKGLPPKEKGHWDVQVATNGRVYGVGEIYNRAIKEFSEREIELDVEATANEIHKGMYNGKDMSEDNPMLNLQLYGIAQALAKADIIKVKEG